MDLLALEPVQVLLCDQLVQKHDRKSVLATVARMYPDTMRIVLSGYTELQSVLDAVNRGEIYRFLVKPWDEDILKQTIREAFQRYRPTSGA
jgi:DNA-binding NtrC family response regulator